MRIINKTTFVIETLSPTGKFKNKEVLNEKTGEMETHPDGEPEREYMWFAGIGRHPQNQKLVGAVWTPYPEQAFRYKDKGEADIVNSLVLGPDAGGSVLSWESCHKAEGRQIIVPIIGAAMIQEGVSNSGIKGGRI